PHVFALAVEQPLRKNQAVTSVGVVRAHLDTRKLAEREFFGAVVEQNAAQAVARVLCPNQVRQSQSNFLSGRKTVLAVKNHAVAAIEHEHGSAGALVFALVDVQVRVIHIQRNLRAFALDGGEQSLTDIKIEGVAELVPLRGARRLNSRGEIPRVVPSEA